MGKNERADLRGIGSNEKHSAVKSKRFHVSDYKHFPHSIQCQGCGSDYMRFAVDGYCQWCQQEAEHAVRDRSAFGGGKRREI